MNGCAVGYWPPVVCAYCGQDVGPCVMTVRGDHPTDPVLDFCDRDHYWRWAASSSGDHDASHDHTADARPVEPTASLTDAWPHALLASVVVIAIVVGVRWLQ